MAKRLVESYILKALVPYTILALVVLTFILLAQQFSRFAEILEDAPGTLTLTFVLAINLLPNVLVFTLPMAMLVGTATTGTRTSPPTTDPRSARSRRGDARSDLRQRLLQIRDHVLGLLVADAEPHHRGRDAEALLVIERHVGMRHRGGVLRERLGLTGTNVGCEMGVCGA